MKRWSRDVILLNKTDLVSADELTKVEDRIRSINATTVIHRAERCETSPRRFLEQRISLASWRSNPTSFRGGS